jgi:hypothetical protein
MRSVSMCFIPSFSTVSSFDLNVKKISLDHKIVKIFWMRPEYI